MENTLFRKYDYPLKGGALNAPLIKIRGRQCECCQNTEWLGQPINLQVHHIDGDRTNNELTNLQLLCPNCHSYTDNFGIKNNKHEQPVSDKELIKALQDNSSIRQALLAVHLSDAGINYKRAKSLIEKHNILLKEEEPKIIEKKYCKNCGKEINITSTYCVNCFNLSQRIVERPTREKFKEMIRNLPFTKIAEQFGVSDKAITKWCIAYNLPSRKKEINSYSDEEWNIL